MLRQLSTGISGFSTGFPSRLAMLVANQESFWPKVSGVSLQYPLFEQDRCLLSVYRSSPHSHIIDPYAAHMVKPVK